MNGTAGTNATRDTGASTPMVTGAVATHYPTHRVTALDADGNALATERFPADPAGRVALLNWLRGLGVQVRLAVDDDESASALMRLLQARELSPVQVRTERGGIRGGGEAAAHDDLGRPA